MLEKFPEYADKKKEEGVYSLINDDILLKFSPLPGVHLNVTNLEESTRYYTKIGMYVTQTVKKSEDGPPSKIYMQFKGYTYFTLMLTQVESIDRADAFGRMAFSCADADVERVF